MNVKSIVGAIHPNIKSFGTPIALLVLTAVAATMNPVAVQEYLVYVLLLATAVTGTYEYLDFRKSREEKTVKVVTTHDEG